jgi:hypothetical protein
MPCTTGGKALCGPAGGDLREIEDASAAMKVQGERYPDELKKMTGL